MTGAVLPTVLPFSAGVLLLQQQAVLPSLAWASLLVPAAALALRYRFLLPVLAFGAGFFWAAACGHWRMDDWLARDLEGRDIDVVGVVSSLPAQSERGTRFEFDVEWTSGGERLPRTLLLWWYRSAAFTETEPALLAGAV